LAAADGLKAPEPQKMPNGRPYAAQQKTPAEAGVLSKRKD